MAPSELVFAVDSVTKRNILHNAVINKERDLIEYVITQIDGDRGELRAMKDYKGKRPQEYDQANQYGENFLTVWDYARDGNVRKLKQCIDTGRFTRDQQTTFLQQTPLHFAVRAIQMEVMKTLIYDYRANPNVPNVQGKSALDLANTTLQPPKGSKATAEAIREHVAGFLMRKHVILKLPGDTLLKEVRKEEKQKR